MYIIYYCLFVLILRSEATVCQLAFWQRKTSRGMKARRHHVSTSEESELIWDTSKKRKKQQSNHKSQTCVSSSRPCQRPLAWQNLIKSKLHLSIFHAHEKDVKRHWGRKRASPSAVLILHPRLRCLAQTHSAKHSHLTTPKPQLILFYHLYQVLLWRSAKSLTIIF